MATGLLVVLGLLGAPAGSLAQSTADAPGWGAFAAASFESKGPWGRVPGRDLFMVGVRRSKALTSGRWTLFYRAALIPAAVLTNNEPVDLQRIPGRLGNWAPSAPRSTAVGFGVMPLGLSLVTPRFRGLSAAGLVTMGLMWFEEAVPYRNAARLNFAGEVGLEVRYGWSPRWSWLAGYRIHHLSNGGVGDVNPGLDGRLFHIGVELIR